MDDIARAHITDGCARAINAVIDPNDPSIWVIDEVRLDLLVDISSAAAPDIAHFWGKRIASAVARVMASGPDGVQVLRFANRAAYLAHLLRNLAEDRAWDKWYFTEFATLRSLPRHAAIREALLREPQEAEAALFELDRTGTLSTVAAQLTRLDQERIVECCANGAAYSEDSLKAVLRMSHAGTWAHESLLGLYLRIRSECPGMSSSSAAGAADHLERVLGWKKAGALRSIVRTMTLGSPALLPLTDDELETARMLRIIAVAGGADLVASVIGRSDARPSGLDADGELHTEIGGVFLLAAVLADVPLLLRYFVGDEAAARRRYLLYALCASAGTTSAWQDPALRVASGMDEIPRLDDFGSIELPELAGVSADAALPEDASYFTLKLDALLEGHAVNAATRYIAAFCAAILIRELARRLPALSAASVRYLWANILEGPARILPGEELIEVILSARPLQIVLRMAGLHERVLELPGCPGRSFVLRFEES